MDAQVQAHVDAAWQAGGAAAGNGAAHFDGCGEGARRIPYDKELVRWGAPMVAAPELALLHAGR